MTLAQQLLLHARQMTAVSEPEPTQAVLRRAVSTAYYAVFHLLTAETGDRLSPGGSNLLATRIVRARTHAEMKQICRAIQNGADAFGLAELHPQGFSKPLRLVAAQFHTLQTERHRADYDPAFVYTVVSAQEIVDRAEALFQAWDTVRATDEANVFCAALLLGTRWAK